MKTKYLLNDIDWEGEELYTRTTISNGREKKPN